ncbi:MAG: hypothetical protein ACTSRZ_15735 [Promethearchaeota archaeon]
MLPIGKAALNIDVATHTFRRGKKGLQNYLELLKIIEEFLLIK